MSMMCWLLRLSPAQIGALRSTPALATDLAEVAEDAQMHAKRALIMSQIKLTPEQRAGLEAQFRATDEAPRAKEAQARIAAAGVRLESFGPLESVLELQKSWHVLNYLFTGHVDEAAAPGNELLTGEPLGRAVGYGPARLQDEKATQSFARFLGTQDAARLAARVDYREMSAACVYSIPSGQLFEADFESELRAEVSTYFPLLREYVSQAAERRQGLLIWLS